MYGELRYAKLLAPGAPKPLITFFFETPGKVTSLGVKSWKKTVILRPFAFVNRPTDKQ